MTQSLPKLPAIVFGNYGNETIALLSLCKAQGLSDITMVSIDTGWAAASWTQRVVQGEEYAKSLGYDVVRLPVLESFSDAVKERHHFPSQKFQWCAGLFKGVTLLEWLDVRDPRATTAVLLGKRQGSGPTLPPKVSKSDHYGEREVFYPLRNMTDNALQASVTQAGFEFLSTRSLECLPCIHDGARELLRLDECDVRRVEALEQEINATMFQTGSIRETLAQAAQEDLGEPVLTKAMGCGDPYACGL